MSAVIARASQTTLDVEQVQHHRRSCYLVPVSIFCQWLLLNPEALQPPEATDRRVWQALWKHVAHLATNLYRSREQAAGTTIIQQQQQQLMGVK